MRKEIIRRSFVEYADLTASYYQGCQHGCLYCYNFHFHRRNFGVTYSQWIKARPKVSILKAKRLTYKAIKHFGPGHKLYLSFAHDPYMPVDGYRRLTYIILDEVLKNSDWIVMILTKAPERALCLDGPLFETYSERVWFGVTLTHYDDVKAKRIEPFAEPPSQRIQALWKAKTMGLKTWVSIEPWIPLLPRPATIESFYEENDRLKDFEEYLVDPVELIKRIPKPDLVIIGRLNHISRKYDKVIRKVYKKRFKEVSAYLNEKGYNFMVKKELMKVI